MERERRGEQIQEHTSHLLFCAVMDRTTIVSVAILPGVDFIDPNVTLSSPLCGFVVSDPGLVRVNQYTICVWLLDGRQVSVGNCSIGKYVHECQKELIQSEVIKTLTTFNRKLFKILRKCHIGPKSGTIVLCSYLSYQKVVTKVLIFPNSKYKYRHKQTF